MDPWYERQDAVRAALPSEVGSMHASLQRGTRAASTPAAQESWCRAPTLTGPVGETLARRRRRRSIRSCCPGEGTIAPLVRLQLAQAATKFCRLVDPPLDHGQKWSPCSACCGHRRRSPDSISHWSPTRAVPSRRCGRLKRRTGSLRFMSLLRMTTAIMVRTTRKALGR